MSLSSAEVARSRPFYADHADLYDLLVTDPVEPWVPAVHSLLTTKGLAPGNILDAGCGTGRQAAALRQLGHRVTLADASPALLRIAANRCPSSPVLLVDLCTLHLPSQFTAVTCRGVLNDLLTDDERYAAFTALAGCLAAGGVLFVDVREAGGARARADGQPRTRVAALPGGGEVAFTSTSTWSGGLIRVSEEHVITGTGASSRSENEFAMRPWTSEELRQRLQDAGLRDVRIGPGVGRSTGDRLFVTAIRP